MNANKRVGCRWLVLDALVILALLIPAALSFYFAETAPPQQLVEVAMVFWTSLFCLFIPLFIPLLLVIIQLILKGKLKGAVFYGGLLLAIVGVVLLLEALGAVIEIICPSPLY
jgi:hypothetical protein